MSPEPHVILALLVLPVAAVVCLGFLVRAFMDGGGIHSPVWLLDRAVLADNRQLAKAVFFEATPRGTGDLMARYFHEVDPEARGLYAQWRETPPTEVLERQGEATETIIPAPALTRLTPPARASA